jgi:DNA end-binding protein Ku
MPPKKRKATPGRSGAMRSLWTGSIAFGLVNVPVRLYPAVREHALHFHYVHTRDNSPIGYQKICKAEQKLVPDEEIVKAFELDGGAYVFMEEEDFESAQAEQTGSIEVSDFVPVDEIDPIFFAKTYYAGPGDGAERVYALFVKALQESELVALGKFVLRDRQHVAALRVRDRVLALEQLHFADEIVDARQIRPKAQRVGAEELALARQLIESATTDWKPSRYKDTYRDELRAAIEAKRTSKATHQAPEIAGDEDAAAPDLLEALRASLAQSKTSGSRRARSSSRRRTASRRRTTRTAGTA